MKMELVVDEGEWIARAQDAIRRGEREEAIAALRRALEHDPDRGAIGQLLAEQLRLAGRPGEALEVVRAALRVSPAGQNLHRMAGELWMESGAPERAAFHFGAAARLLPASAIAHRDAAQRRQAEALRAAGRWAEAIALLRDLRARSELPASSARLLAELLLEAPDGLRDASLALAVAESAARDTEESDAATLDTLAAAQAANGRAGDAVRTQERALALWRESGPAERAAAAEQRLADYRRAAGR
jgi:tetratricopeptide (TPR) repeat protein